MMERSEGVGSELPDTKILVQLVEGAQALDARRAERGMVHGRRTSTPLSRRAPADLDAIVLTDRRTGVVAVLHRWADRVRQEAPASCLPAPRRVRMNGAEWTVEDAPTLDSEAAVLAEHWEWVTAQDWAADMLGELADLLVLLDHGGRRVHLVTCPVCGYPVDADTFVRDHRACLSVPL